MLQIVLGPPNINVTACTGVAQPGDTTGRAGCSLNILSPHMVTGILKPTLAGLGLDINNAVIVLLYAT
jgi:hypothetical protein